MSTTVSSAVHPTCRESEVRYYCRRFPGVLSTARGSTLRTEDGREVLDFLLGAGALNYGHNHPELVEAITGYLAGGGPLHTLDLRSEAKELFMEGFARDILAPRGLDYRLQFVGPTGTNAVEAAIKLARKATGRTEIVAFTGAFHGMTAASLALSAKRNPAPRQSVIRMPYDGFLGPDIDTLPMIEAMLTRPGSGYEPPAAIVLEVVQGDGGLNAASRRWCREIAALARSIGALLIVDDIQAGCGRAGSFFSFEPFDLRPDVVLLSKSLSGSGLPMSLVLIDPALDAWSPGEHTGTFRGNTLAFVTATVAASWWRDDALERSIAARAEQTRVALDAMAATSELVLQRRGRGLFQGLVFRPGYADSVAEAALEEGLLVETAGPRGEVLKTMPAVNISAEELDRGMQMLARAVARVTAGAGELAAAS